MKITKERKNKSKGYDKAICVRTESSMHDRFMRVCHEAQMVPADIVRSVMLRIIEQPDALEWLKSMGEGGEGDWSAVASRIEMGAAPRTNK